MKETKESENLNGDTPQVAEKYVAELEQEIENLRQEAERTKADRDALSDRLIRLMAEFDNFRKRSEKERLQLIEQANAGLISALLPVLDDLQRSLDSAQESDNAQALIAGIRMVNDNFIRILAERGVETIESVGQEFDPEQHEAIMQLEVESVEPNRVVEEHQKGYRLNGRVLRHSQVVVSR
ncbi:nucleotide exchange factor GrpE [candidate division KSB1 bacterium]|nr:nucleotide exchange factor GrpE [candidate division KSB1 bacterium]